MRDRPAPQRSWVMAQTWRDLLFAHWPVPVAETARLIPSPLELDTFDGQAWIGVIPFRMDGIRPRGGIALPWVSETPEINVRTYVRHGEKRGVYFLSLHATNRAAVVVARRFFHLPYYHAEMNVRSEGERVRYEIRRDSAEFRAHYSPAGDDFASQPGSLESWLTERYCFFTVDKQGRVSRGEVDHPAWPLQGAEASIEVNTMTTPFGITLPDSPPVLHFSRKLDVVMWMPERLPAMS